MANPAQQEDMYSDTGVEAAEPVTSESEDSESEGQTALLPKSLCPGMNPGDRLVLRVVAAHDDQYEVAYEEKREEENEAPAEAPMPESMGGRSDMDEMMA